MPIINIAFGVYALLRLALRAFFRLALGIRWSASHLMVILMLFLKYCMPLILVVTAWFFLSLGFWWWVLSDKQLATGAQWFAAAMTTLASPFVLVGLHNLGAEWRKGKVLWQ